MVGDSSPSQGRWRNIKAQQGRAGGDHKVTLMKGGTGPRQAFERTRSVKVYEKFEELQEIGN